MPDDQLPLVVSSSYDDDEETVSNAFAEQACNMIAQLGARGVTVVVDSGDCGVGLEGSCFTNDGRNGSTFLPQFPSSCPFALSVGGTKNFNPEVAALGDQFDPPFTSGGGFSNLFARPAYQNAAVGAYLKANDNFPNYAGLFNLSGRAYPDVASNSQNFATIWAGAFNPFDGTSGSTPAVAGILALVNVALLAAGKSPLGFVNPWLYRGVFEAFNDILSGSRAGCSTPGFPAGQAWDAITGFGSPRFTQIISLLGLQL
jgi:tripeptidyl-peptidase-1